MRIELTTGKLVTFTLAVMVFGATAGALFGTPVVVEDDQRRVVQRASLITNELMAWLPEEEAPSDLVYDGIAGMLEVLDPHSNFLDPRTYRQMRERQEGSFFGVGIIISRRNGQVTVISPMPGTPAAAKGLRAGDIIAAVDEVETEGLTLDEVVDHVRGPEGSPVVLKIRRPGLQEDFDAEILRARIPTTSVRFAFLIEPEIGYIRLGEFTNTSVREVAEAIERLRSEGMESLVFDLRNNPGGPLDAAVGVSDLFLNKGQLIVSTRGRTEGSVSTLSAPGRSDGFPGPLVILVNEGSASASEIVAGAVQDHDRGLVVGETTWGKGLVQTVFGVRDGGLALTTARYYTPSGRCIQRDYESFIDYVTHRNGNDGDASREVHETDAGRTVFGGGGINPDITIENREFSEPVVRLYGASAFFRYAVELLKDIPENEQEIFAHSFEPGGEDLGGFRTWIEEEEILSSEGLAEFDAEPQAVADAGRALKIELLNATDGLEAGYRKAIDADDQYRGALEHMEDAADLWQAWPKPNQG